MKVLINTSTSAMTFPCGGLDFPLMPRSQAHPSQSSQVYAVVYDETAIDPNTKDFIDRNVRRRYCALSNALTLEGLRPGQVFVIRKDSAARLDLAEGRLTSTLTMEAVQARVPELFPGGEVPVAEHVPTAAEMGHSIKPPSRTVYVSRDGGHFQTPWNQVKPGDTLMIREDSGEYVKDKATGEQEFVAVSAPYMAGGVWTVDTVPLSKKPAALPVNGDSQTAVDTAKAGQSDADGAAGDDDASDADDDEGDDDSDADDDSGDDSEETKGTTETTAQTEKPSTQGLSAAKPPSVGGTARKSRKKGKGKGKGQGSPAARTNRK